MEGLSHNRNNKTIATGAEKKIPKPIHVFIGHPIHYNGVNSDRIVNSYLNEIAVLESDYAPFAEPNDMLLTFP